MEIEGSGALPQMTQISQIARNVVAPEICKNRRPGTYTCLFQFENPHNTN